MLNTKHETAETSKKIKKMYVSVPINRFDEIDLKLQNF